MGYYILQLLPEWVRVGMKYAGISSSMHPPHLPSNQTCNFYDNEQWDEALIIGQNNGFAEQRDVAGSGHGISRGQV